MNSKDIGNIFREAREKKGLTAEDVYQKIKIHIRVIGDIEAGAFDRLAPLYMKSFLKKYADLLELDADSLLEQFEKASRKSSPRFSSPYSEEKKEKTVQKDRVEKNPEKKPEEKPAKPEKKEKSEKKRLVITRQHIQTVAVSVLAMVFVVLVFVLADMVRNWKPFGRTQDGTAMVLAANGDAKNEAAASRKAKTSAKEETGYSPVNLTLKAKGKSWVQVKQGDKNLFASVMENGDTHSWKADGTITVQTGKAENLEFTVNRKNLGTIAAGVVKNIKVSGEGVKIGEKVIPLR